MRKANRRYAVLIVSALLAPVFNAAYAISSENDSIFIACRQCHVEFKHRSSIPLNVIEKCGECHRDMPKHTDEKSPATKSNQPVDPMQGMSVPMFYSETRIGADPNPMIEVPAGEFIMGTNDRLPDEGPQHTVFLPTYLIDKYEVTNLQYKKFIDATNRRSPNHFKNRTFPEGKADHPVTFVSWTDADAYCTWAGKRLPTDQEWEKAARGADGQHYPWGNDFDFYKANTPHRWLLSGKEGDTAPVGSFEEGKSPYGLFDMTGNVWEWTSSWYLPYPGNNHHTENYGETYKTLKGGSWWDCSFYQCGISAPSFNRSFFLRNTKNTSFGFRCAKDSGINGSAQVN